MLVLRRRTGQSIVTSTGIRFTVLSTSRNYAKIGIDGPAEVTFVRPEVVERAIANGTLDSLERRIDLAENAPCRPAEDDMISAPRARAMAQQVATLQAALEHLREENAGLRAKLQDKEHVG